MVSMGQRLLPLRASSHAYCFSLCAYHFTVSRLTRGTSIKASVHELFAETLVIGVLVSDSRAPY